MPFLNSRFKIFKTDIDRWFNIRHISKIVKQILFDKYKNKNNRSAITKL